MNKSTYDIRMINDAFKLYLHTDHLEIQPIADGTKFFFLRATDSSYAVKVPVTFISKLEKVASLGIRMTHPLMDLFTDDFLQLRIPSFRFFPRLGFIAKDYSEFFIDISFDLYKHMNSNIIYGVIDKLKGFEFYIESMKVRISWPSSLFNLLNSKFDGDYHFVDDLLTIKLKGTLAESIDDDIYTALYYLNALLPTENDNLPRIGLITLEKASKLSNHVKYQGSMSPTSTITKFPKPSYPIALKFFYHANQLTRQGAVHEAILYFYKVLEHFFEIAWHHHIGEMVLQADGDLSKLAKLIDQQQPRRDQAYLQLVLKSILSDTLWNTISHNEVWEISNINALADKIYESRNGIAHGKLGDKFEINVPSILPDLGISKKLEIFQMIAKEVLIKYCGVIL